MSDFDHDILAEIYEIDPDTYVEVIDSFINKWPATVGELDGCLQEADADQLMRVAHKLKGGGRTIGLVRLGHAAQAIEQTARGGDATGCRALMPELIASGEEAITFLKHIRDNPPAI